MINESLLKNEERIVYGLRTLYSSFGYSQYKMSKFEEYDLYVRNKDFLISDRIITFTDTNGKLLALKPDVTLSIINNYSGKTSLISKMYYNENVYRVSGTNGRFKEIMQTGLECIGKIGIYEITEVLHLAIKSLGVIDGDFRLELSHTSLLDALLLDAHIDSKVLRDVKNSIKMKSSAICEQLYCENKINSEQKCLINVLNSSYADAAEFEKDIKAFISSENTKKAFDEFICVLKSNISDSNKGRLSVNFSLSADAGYYSGIVFKGYINGIPVCVLSGGQYDKLMKKIGEDAGAVGFAVYLDSLERFKTEAPEYDIDTVLVVDSFADAAKVLEYTENLISQGQSVIVQTAVPENIRYKRVLNWEEV